MTDIEKQLEASKSYNSSYNYAIRISGLPANVSEKDETLDKQIKKWFKKKAMHLMPVMAFEGCIQINNSNEESVWKVKIVFESSKFVGINRIKSPVRTFEKYINSNEKLNFHFDELFAKDKVTFYINDELIPLDKNKVLYETTLIRTMVPFKNKKTKKQLEKCLYDEKIPLCNVFKSGHDYYNGNVTLTGLKIIQPKSILKVCNVI